MKNLILMIALIYTGFCTAQITSEFEAETSAGYESNIFKAPNSLIDPDSGATLGKDDLYTSSFYQKLGFKALFTKPWKNQQLSLRLRPIGTFYYSENDASYFGIYSRLRYENEFSKKTRLQIETHYNYKNREGENFDNNELRTPLGYRHIDASAGLFFRLYKQNRSFLKFEVGNRNYKDGETNDLSYDYYEISTIFRNVFKREAGYHSYGLEFSYSNRFYKRTFFDTTEPIVKRDWKYVNIMPFYRLPITKKWRLKPYVEWSTRIDNDNGNFTYNQIKPGLELRYKTEKFLLETEASFTNRTYKSLRATNSDNVDQGLLNMKYYRLRVTAEKKVSNKLSITANAYINNRVSNRTNINSSFFRGYDYYYAGLGLKYTF